MAIAYRIKGWESSGFEVSQNSRTRGPLKWVAIPTKHDGKGFRRLMRHKEGTALFGCWCLIVQVAAKCPTRGVLADDDGPLSSSDLHLKTGAPEELMEKALRLLSEEVGWLEKVEVGFSPPFDTLQQIVADPQQSVAACNKVLPTRQDVQDETVRNETGQDSAPQAADVPDRADEMLLPTNLDTHAFRASWKDWLTYRRESRKSVRGLTLEKQLQTLSRWGPAKAQDAIENSIRNGWTGLFEPTENVNGRRTNTQGGADATRVRSERTDGDFANIPVVSGGG